MSNERLARYVTRVHASNRHASLGLLVTVLAANRKEAVSRAVTIGWGGDARDARVTIQSVEDIDPRETHAREVCAVLADEGGGES